MAAPLRNRSNALLNSAGGNPWPAILDLQRRQAVAGAQDDLDRRALGRVAERIVDEVQHDPLEQRGDAAERDGRRRGVREGPVLLLRDRRERLGDLVHQHVEPHQLRCACEARRIAFDRAEREQVLAEPLEPLGLLERVHQAGTVLLERRRPGDGGLEVGAQSRHRRAQLVRGVGGEALEMCHRGLEPPEHAIEHVDDAIDLAGRSRGQSVIERAGLDGLELGGETVEIERRARADAPRPGR